MWKLIRLVLSTVIWFIAVIIGGITLFGMGFVSFARWLSFTKGY